MCRVFFLEKFLRGNRDSARGHTRVRTCEYITVLTTKGGGRSFKGGKPLPPLKIPWSCGIATYCRWLKLVCYVIKMFDSEEPVHTDLLTQHTIAIKGYSWTMFLILMNAWSIFLAHTSTNSSISPHPIPNILPCIIHCSNISMNHIHT